MSRDVHLDVETRSPIDLKKTGVYRYTQDPDTDVWMVCYAFDDGPVQTWWPGMPAPDFQRTDTFYAWNAQFERIIWRDILAPRYGWPTVRLSQWQDVMVWALAMGLPPALDFCASALSLGVRKDLEGRKLMLKMAKPRRPKKGQDRNRLYWWDSVENRQRLAAYCATDVEVERQVADEIPRPPRSEWEHWILDQKINDTGWRIDKPLVNACVDIIGQRIEHLNDEMIALTEGGCQGVTKVQQLKDWLRDTHNLEVESLDKDHAPLFLKDPSLPAPAKRAIELRVEGSQTSNGKLDAMLRAEVGERIYGMFRYSYASTGRWSSTLVQLHNMPHGAKKRTPALCKALMGRDVDLIEVLWGPPMKQVSDALRGCLIAENGHSLSVVDFSQIEARINAYLAGQEDMVLAFRYYDAGTGQDVYVFQAKKIGSDDRQLGKVMVLALGYGMGADKFRDTALKYGIEFVYVVEEYIDVETGEVRTRVLQDEADDIKTAWRSANPAIVQFWWDLEDAAIAAVDNPGTIFSAGYRDMVKFRTRGDHLWCQLPSGRAICYPFPVLKMAETPWGSQKLQLSYMTMKDGRWVRNKTYGGHLCENVVQATAADVLKLANRKIHDRVRVGAQVGHVHDEPIVEGPRKHEQKRLAQILAIMNEPVTFLPGCPISADGFNTTRYQKG